MAVEIATGLEPSPPEDDTILLSPEELERLLAGIDFDLPTLLNPLEGPLETIAREGIRWVVWVGERLLQLLIATGGPMWRLLQLVFSPITDLLGLAVGLIRGDISLNAEWVRDRLLPGILDLQGTAGSIFDTVSSFVGDVAGEVGNLLSSLAGSISSALSSGVNALGGFLGDVADWLDEEVAQPLRAFREEVTGVFDSLGISAIAGGALGFLEDVGRRLREGITSMAGTFRNIIGGALGLFLDLLEAPLSVFLRPLLALIRKIGGIPPELEEMLGQAEKPTSLGAGVVLIPLVIGSLAALAANVSRGLVADLQHRINAFFLPQLIGQDDLVLLWWRRPQQRDKWEEEAAKLGVSRDKLTSLLEARRRSPFASDLHDLVNRELLPIEEAVFELVGQGYRAPHAKAMMELRRVFPGVQDVVRFAVREAFREDIAALFQLDEDFDKIPLDKAARIGLHPEDMRYFWRAHWDLPSLTQGFDMFHRTVEASADPGADTLTLSDGRKVQNVIGRGTLETLLRVQDVMPFWRDKLVEIAYDPITRIDVRRMHRMGIFSDAEVERAYLDLGYNQANARRLMDFVVELNTEAAKGAFQGVAIRRFKEGWDTAGDLQGNLLALGYGQGEIDRLILGAQLEYELDYFSDLLAVYQEAFRKNQIDDREFDTLLADLGMVPDRRRALIQREVLKKTPKLKPPRVEVPPELTLAQVGAAFKRGDLLEVELRAELADRGYSERDINILVEQYRAAPPPPPPTLSVAQLSTALRRRILSEETLRAELAERGYSAEDVDILVAIAREPPPKPTPARIRELSLADLRGLLATDIITEMDFLDGLAALGLTEQDAVRLLELELIKRAARESSA